jgi:probable poly-beta-1,6-N-acetyl-D-glucosamine export protein
VQLYSLTIFRAAAIVLVVLSHAEALGAVSIDTPAEIVFSNVVSGATTLFVFISGFLFHHVFLKKFESKSFLRKKLLNLGVPYLILSCAAFALGCAIDATGQVDGWLGQLQLGGFMLGTGSAAVSYWYIPFVLTLFAMAPVHVRFAALGMRSQLAIIGVLLAAAFFVHRPVDNIGALQNLVYYTPTYLIGMFCSQHRDRVYPLLANWTWPLLAASLGLAVLELAIGGKGNYSKPMLEFGGFDVMLAQKLCLSLFLLSFLHRFEAWRSRTVDMVAETSFAIFFLHPLFIELFSRNSLVTPLLARESWPMYFAGSVLCVGTCCALALWARRVFGQRSRFLTGY